MTDKTLTPVEEKTIAFYDGELTAVRLADRPIHVPVARFCDNLGLSWAGQRERINRHTVPGKAAKTIRVTRMVKEGGRGGSPVDTLCLPLNVIPGWLFGVTASRARDEIRPKLTRYRRECFQFLWDAFKADILPAMDPALAQEAGDLTLAERALARVEALYTLAKNQVALERWLVHHDRRIDQVEDVASAAHDRLDKAAELAETVTLAPAPSTGEALAHRLSEQDPGKNHYQAVWGELHRRYNVNTYRRVPAAKFAEVIAWLEGWLESLAADRDG